MNMPANQVVNGKGGRFVGTKGLTDKQAAFVRYYVRNGGNQTAAADSADYGDAGARAWELMRNPRVLAAIHAEREREIGDLATLGLKRIREILETPQDTLGGKELQGKLAMQLLDRAGHSKLVAAQGAPGDQGRPLAELSLDELDSMVRDYKQRLAALETVPAGPVIDGALDACRGDDAHRF